MILWLFQENGAVDLNCTRVGLNVEDYSDKSEWRKAGSYLSAEWRDNGPPLINKTPFLPIVAPKNGEKRGRCRICSNIENFVRSDQDPILPEIDAIALLGDLLHREQFPGKQTLFPRNPVENASSVRISRWVHRIFDKEEVQYPHYWAATLAALGLYRRSRLTPSHMNLSV